MKVSSSSDGSLSGCFSAQPAVAVAKALACMSLLLMFLASSSDSLSAQTLANNNDNQQQQYNAWRLEPRGLLEWEERGIDMRKEDDESDNNDVRSRANKGEALGAKLHLPNNAGLVSWGKNILSPLGSHYSSEFDDEILLREEPAASSPTKERKRSERVEQAAKTVAYMMSPLSGRLIEVGKHLERGGNRRTNEQQQLNFAELLLDAAELMSSNSASQLGAGGASEFVYQIKNKQNNNKSEQLFDGDKGIHEQQLSELSTSFQTDEPNRIDECRTIRSTILLTRDQFELPSSSSSSSASNGPKLAQHSPITHDSNVNNDNNNNNNNNNRQLVRSCKGLVQVNKCEGFCSSIVRPSIKSRVGFKKECFCCNEGSLKRVQLRLNQCYSAIDNRRISPEEDEQRSFMDIEVEEPVDCKCRRCNSLL